MNPLLGILLIIVLIGVSIVISLSKLPCRGARGADQGAAEAGNKKAQRFVALRADSGRVITAFQIATMRCRFSPVQWGRTRWGVLRPRSAGPGRLCELAVPIGFVLAFVFVTALFVCSPI